MRGLRADGSREPRTARSLSRSEAVGNEEEESHDMKVMMMGGVTYEQDIICDEAPTIARQLKCNSSLRC